MRRAIICRMGRSLMLCPVLCWMSTFAADVETDRKVAAADTLVTDVLAQKDQSIERRVEQGGTINYPLPGNVTVAGKTTVEIAALLQQRRGDDYLVRPQVSVNVKEYSVRTVTVLGEVAGRVGAIKLPGEKQMDILEAIAEAGNFTANANKNKIQLTRKGQTTGYKLSQLLKLTDPKRKIWLEHGDIIYVPERFF